MADSIEQKLVTRALEVCAAINGTGGYLTTLGTMASGDQSIADSQSNWDQDELPSLSVFQGETTVEERDDEGRKVLRALHLMFRGLLERDNDPAVTASNARKFLADIQRAIRVAGDRWTVSGVPLAFRTEEGTHRIEYAADSFEIVGVQQEITIDYQATNLDMENQ